MLRCRTHKPIEMPLGTSSGAKGRTQVLVIGAGLAFEPLAGLGQPRTLLRAELGRRLRLACCGSSMAVDIDGCHIPYTAMPQADPAAQLCSDTNGAATHRTPVPPRPLTTEQEVDATLCM